MSNPLAGDDEYLATVRHPAFTDVTYTDYFFVSLDGDTDAGVLEYSDVQYLEYLVKHQKCVKILAGTVGSHYNTVSGFFRNVRAQGSAR